MAQLTSDNIKRVEELETIDATNEKNAFFVCGHDKHLFKINFERLRKKINGTVLPTKKPEALELGELWLEPVLLGTSEKKLATNIDVDFSKQGQFIAVNGFVYILDRQGQAYKINKENGEQERLFEGVAFSFLCLTSSMIIFFSENALENSKGLIFSTGEVKPWNVNSTGALGLEVVKVINATYPMQNLGGFIVNDYEANKNFDYYQFTENETSIGIKFVEHKDASEIEATEGSIKGLCSYAIQIKDGAFVDKEIVVFPIINGVLTLTPELKVYHEIKNCFYRIYSNTTTEKAVAYGVLIGNNQATLLKPYNPENFLSNYELYTDELVTNEVVSYCETLNAFYLLQKTTDGRMALSQYKINFDTLEIEKSLVKIIEGATVNNAFMFVDPEEALKDIDNTKIIPNVLILEENNTTELIEIESTYEYELRLSYGDKVQEIQGYRGEQGLKGEKGDKGDKGEQGIQGIQGLKGDKGDTGEKGADGLTQEQVESVVNSAIAEIIANAPEDLDTLKEIADWIDTHEDSASAMNSSIQTNKTNIEKKVDKVSGKGLSTNDFSNTYKSTVDALQNDCENSIKGKIEQGYEFLEKKEKQHSGEQSESVYVDLSSFEWEKLEICYFRAGVYYGKSIVTKETGTYTPLSWNHEGASPYIVNTLTFTTHFNGEQSGRYGYIYISGGSWNTSSTINLKNLTQALIKMSEITFLYKKL